MKDIIRKLSSRKLWVTIVADIAGVATLLSNSSDDTVKTVAAIILIACSTVTYVLGEAKIDSVSAAKVVVDALSDILTIIEHQEADKKTLPTEQSPADNLDCDDIK